jgi:hypothetical protein
MKKKKEKKERKFGVQSKKLTLNEKNNRSEKIMLV